MAVELTADFVKSVSPPPKGSQLHWDTKVPQFGLRVTAGGAKSFFLNYRTRGGTERRYTISRVPTTYVDAALKDARVKAERLQARIKHDGFDPVKELRDERQAETMGDLCTAFLDPEQRGKKISEATVADYEMMVKNVIRPRWGTRKIKEIDTTDVEKLHRDITKNGTRGSGRGAPYRANRVVALLSSMFGFAVKRKWRAPGDNPTIGVDRNDEISRTRHLDAEELEALLRTLAERDAAKNLSAAGRDRTANNIVRMLLLTGARSGETIAMKWGEVDLGKGTWTKPSHHTKNKREHKIPLSAPARLLLTSIRDELKKPPSDNDPVFRGHGIDTAQTTIKKSWSAIRARATVLYLERRDDAGAELIGKLRKVLQREPTLNEVDKLAAVKGIELHKGLRDLRPHDLRHSYASFLVNEGLSLPTIGALLGHTQAGTTFRYAHLFDDPLRKATERVGDIIAGAGKTGDTVVPIKAGG